MHTLSKRFNYLRGVEAAAVVILPVLFIRDWRKSPDSVHWPLGIMALALVSYLLLQGAIYWHLKHRALAGSTGLPAFFGTLFKAFKVSNVCLLGLGALGFIAQIMGAGWDARLAWPLGIFIFAVLEHINYYHYQLMYDTTNAWRYLHRNRRLRKAALGIDLQRASVR
jgi:hypothetical protein